MRLTRLLELWRVLRLASGSLLAHVLRLRIFFCWVGAEDPALELVALDQTSHHTFHILKLGTHCVLKIRPLDKYVQNIKIEFQYGNQTSHHS
jgi:hypothetical protein